MRRLFVSFGIVLGLLMIPAVDGGASASSGTALSPVVYAAATDASQAPQINVEIDKGGKWYASPIWIAIGVIAAVLVLILLVMAFRGGGTTVVHR